MGVKLYNSSRLPDETLKTVLNWCKRQAGSQGDVVVTVGSGSHRRTSGQSHACCQVALGNKWINTAGGTVHISPCIHPKSDPLWCAEQFIEVAVHEFHHNKEDQLRERIRTYSERVDAKLVYSGDMVTHGRRCKWADRPEEIRACNAIYDWKRSIEMERQRRNTYERHVLELAGAFDNLLRGVGDEAVSRLSLQDWESCSHRRDSSTG